MLYAGRKELLTVTALVILRQDSRKFVQGTNLWSDLAPCPW